MKIEEFIEGSNKTTSIEELFGLYQKAMSEVGFDRLIFSLMTDHTHIRKRAGHGIVLNYPAEWMTHYTANDYAVFDPVRCQMHAADNVFIWDDLLERAPLTKKQAGCLREGEDAGLRDGIGIPLRGPHGAIAGIGAASSTGHVDLDKNILSYVNLISHQFYTAFLSLEKTGQSEEIYLTEKEREILQWSAKGKTRWEVGEIMGISENTVIYHLKNIFQKLECNNITMAVLKALYSGIIQL